MQSLKSLIKKVKQSKTAIGHFNISDFVTLRAIFEAAKSLNLPVIIGTSEGERDFMGAHEAVALVKFLRKRHDFPIFINADHTHSMEKAKEAIDVGYDAVLFDGSKLPFEENIQKTKEVVEYARSKNKKIIIEGEHGYIGSSSVILKEVPEGAATEEKDMTTREQAERFVRETGVDLFAPAVGNIHGMLQGGENIKHLNFKRIKEIKRAARVPLVLHGGSGTPDEDFLKAIEAGMSIVHVNTELRVAWRQGLEKGLRENPEEVTPYKIMKPALDEIKQVVYNRLKLFNRI
ncbi:MAG TPA: class II fructose-bisphosphate aldolase [Candidatus Paceibacterota bacterium]